MRANIVVLILLVSIGTPLFAGEGKPAAPPGDQKVAVEDVIPFTMANLRGHKMVYNEGWYIVTSSRKALEFAKDHSLVMSRDAIREAVASSSSRGKDYASNITADVKRCDGERQTRQGRRH